MSKSPILFFGLFLLIFGPMQAQTTIEISGTAIDDLLETPVEAATVFLSYQKDSTVIDYSLTDSNGKFKMQLKKVNEPVFFTISDDLVGEFSTSFDGLTEDKKLGDVRLKFSIDLDGAVVSAAPPIRVKSDTLEFNASSFKVRPDANVEELLKQLPGVDIDEDGKITVNGKEVNKILVNGKTFFDQDGKVVLQNLPAEIINKVQVTDTKTKKEELSGRKASGNEATLNFTIDEDKNKGIILKLLAGLGTDDRYESSFLFNYFKGSARLSVLGSSNNINSVGFSMNEIFDNMGTGRNKSTWASGDGSFGINGMRFGASGNGITQSYLGGLSYSNDFGKDIELSANYYYNQTDTKNNNFTRQENLLPNHIYTTESTGKTRNESFNHNLNANIEMKVDKSSRLSFEPKYNYSKTKSSNVFDKFSVDEGDVLLNESEGETEREALNQNFSNTINYFKSFQNKTSLDFEFSNESKRVKSDDFDLSETFFHQGGDPADLRNRWSRNLDKNDRYKLELEYEISLTDSLHLGFGVNYEKRDIDKLTESYDFDPVSGSYLIFNDAHSSDVTSRFHQTYPFASFRLQKKKFNFSLNTGLALLEQRNEGFYMGQNYELKQDKTAPNIQFNGNYRFSQNSSLYVNYSYSTNFASAEQLLPIENISNPLVTYQGNPNLKPTRSHTFYGGYNSFNFQSKFNVNLYVGGTYYDNQVVMYRTVDENFKTFSTYENVSGNYSFWSGMHFNKSLNKAQNKWRLSAGPSFSMGHNQGFVDGMKYDADNYNLRFRVGANYEYDKLLFINPSYNISYQFTDYKNYRIDRSETVTHTFRLETTNYWPKNFVFGNDFSYNYNSKIADGFKKDYFIWNTSLAYNFYRDQFTFKVKVYDLLGENTGDKRTISATAITDVQNDVLKRYVMFSLGYKLDQFGGKKNKRRGGRFMQFD